MYYGKKTMLRQLKLEDLDEMTEAWNDLELRQTLHTTLPAAKEMEEKFIRETWENMQKQKSYTFAITTHGGKFIGSTGLHGVDHLNQSTNMGIAIYRKEDRGKGYGTDAVIALCGVAFRFLNFNRVGLNFNDNNSQGQKAYEKAGFSHTGKKRQAIYRDGKFHDLMIMDILRDEWFEKFGDDYDLMKPKNMEL